MVTYKISSKGHDCTTALLASIAQQFEIGVEKHHNAKTDSKFCDVKKHSSAVCFYCTTIWNRWRLLAFIAQQFEIGGEKHHDASKDSSHQPSELHDAIKILSFVTLIDFIDWWPLYLLIDFIDWWPHTYWSILLIDDLTPVDRFYRLMTSYPLFKNRYDFLGRDVFSCC